MMQIYVVTKHFNTYKKVLIRELFLFTNEYQSKLAEEGTRTPMSYDIRTWNVRVYQFHHLSRKSNRHNIIILHPKKI